MEPVEAAAIGNELGPLLLEHLPDRLVGPLGMAVRLGPGDAFVHEPGVQLVVALEPQPRREEALTHESDLVLDLALLPAGGRIAELRLEQEVADHGREARVDLALLSAPDLVDGGSHITGWTSPAFLPALLGTKEESMSLELLAIDLGKRSFHCHGIDSDGIVLSRKVSRAKLLETIKELAPKAVAMEACASAHFWGRRLLAEGRRVLLINPWL